MSVLNVVQPGDFDPSSFTVTDGKLKVAISSKEGNILVNNEDGLYAPSGETDEVLGRYIYSFDDAGDATHKDITFHVFEIDGALEGHIQSNNSEVVTSVDSIFYNGRWQSVEYDNGKYVVRLPWGVEHMQRVILKLYKDGKPLFWIAKVIRHKNANSTGIGIAVLVIDEMVNIGNLNNEGGEEEEVESPVEPPLSPSDKLTHIGMVSSDMQPNKYSVVYYDDDKFALVKLDENKQPLFDSPDNITGQLALPVEETDLKAIFSYCPISGAVIYHVGDKYWVVAGKKRVALDLPVLIAGIIGISFGMNADGSQCIFCYSMDYSYVYFQILSNTENMTLTERRSHVAPEGTIIDRVVSGGFAHYLYTRDNNYYLTTIDLLTGESTEHSLVTRDEGDAVAKLIPVALGGVIAYIDKNIARITFPNLAAMNMQTQRLELKFGNPEVIQSNLMFIDLLPNVGFAMENMEFFKFFIDVQSMSMLRFSSSMMEGSLASGNADFPPSYLNVLMSGKMAVPLTYASTTMAFDESEDGHILTYQTLELGAASKMYQATSLLRFPAIGKMGVMAIDPDNKLSLFSSSFGGAIDTSFNYIDQEQPYAQTISGALVWDQNAHAAAWVGKDKHVYLARFDTTTIAPVITDLGETTNEYPWLEISHDSSGDVHVSEKATNNGIDIKVWKVDINNGPAVTYHKESIVDETALFEGEHLVGNKLVVFETSNVGGVSGTRLRAINLETDESIISDQIPSLIFPNSKFANLTGNTFVVVNKLFVDGALESSGTRILIVTVNDTEIIVEDTGVLPLLNAKALVNSTSMISSGIASDGNRVVDVYVTDNGTNYILRVSNANDVINLSRYQVTDDLIQASGIMVQEGLPAITLTSVDTAFVQHDLTLSSLNSVNLMFEPYSIAS